MKAKVSDKGCLEPEFDTSKRDDLMTRGGKFFAFYNDSTGLWDTDEGNVPGVLDEILKEDFNLRTSKGDTVKRILYFSLYSTNSWSRWKRFCRELPDKYRDLDRNIIFANQEVKKSDYASFKLDYPIEEGPTESWDEIMDTLYSPSERQKLEWALGAIISGDAKRLQKFIVIYGDHGTGKGTFLNIVEDMFGAYCTAFSAYDLGDSRKSFALEPFRTNPLIAIDEDGDLSKINTNTRLNTIISHESSLMNIKNVSQFPMKFDAFLFMGSNKPVKITDNRSGLIRRLIDVAPTGKKIPASRYRSLIKKVKFEYGAIAYRCLELYESLGFDYYNKYKPIKMMQRTNDIYDFLSEEYDEIVDKPYVQGKYLWSKFKKYCEDNGVKVYCKYIEFREDVSSYFSEYAARYLNYTSVFIGFKKEMFDATAMDDLVDLESLPDWLRLERQQSFFDSSEFNDPAQLAGPNGAPKCKWVEVEEKKMTLSMIDTSRLHYVKVPINHIVIDFDIPDENGNKSLETNLKAASSWPKTYAELSKSGAGVHLHYIYTGDPTQLSAVYDDKIEIKVFTGNSSLRRKLTLCNNEQIATISSGLPLKGEKASVINEKTVLNEKAIRTLIKRNLRKEIHNATKPSIDFIYKILSDAYNNEEVDYDVSDMRPAIMAFANNSSHQALYCVKMVNKMPFRCRKFEMIAEEGEIGEHEEDKRDLPIIFWDVEVFENLFVICWKKRGEGNPKIRMINPTSKEVDELIHAGKLVGFNNRNYDNHITYAASMGYSVGQLYKLSQRIISGSENAKFGEAYNLSYTDIYDFSKKKQSLKKWEIELGIHHHELGLKWDEPVPEELWETVADYCCDDVEATEAVFEHLQGDFTARRILAKIAGMTVNDTTNSLTTKILVGDRKKPQDEYVYTDLSTIFPGYEYNPYGFKPEDYIPGTKIISGKSRYRGEDPGEGGYKIAFPGMYVNVALLDVASEHPTSAIQLNIFGDDITRRFKDLVEGRLAVKHIKEIGDEHYILACDLLGEFIADYFSDESDGLTVGDKSKLLADALKLAINSVYGLTSAKFANKLRDPRNVDNIVAKRGALFMIDLKHEILDRGYTVVHISTDSIKIADADNEIIAFVMEFGKKFGYTFEHEATYEKMCIVNDAVYIAKYASADWCKRRYGYIPDKNYEPKQMWTATGTQFAVPYVFKTLFSKEPIEFGDMCEVKSVTTSLYLDLNEGLGEDEHDYKFVGRVGQFCPIKSGYGAGILLREKDGKYSAATGSKGYRWLESETVRTSELEEAIDRSYYNDLVDRAKDTISQYCDFYAFAS